MDRRDFVKVLGASGLTIPSWGWLPAQAQTNGYTGRVLVNVVAQGGLSQNEFADPRESSRENSFWFGTAANVSGNIRSAPIAANKAFFDKYFSMMLVINGVQLETNGHDEALQTSATGSLAMGYPNVAELFAAKYGASLPLAYMNSGGFNTSVGLRAAVPTPSADTFRGLISPNQQSATNDFMKQADLDKVFVARAERMKAQIARTDALPRAQTVAQQFVAAGDSRALMARIAAGLPATFDQRFASAEIGLLAAQAGIAATMQVSTGFIFDAHSNIANSYATNLPRLTDLVDFIWTKAAQLGIDNRLFVRIQSDVGREPMINSGNGKDHWPVTTAILMEKGAAWGNRVFGAAGPKHEAQAINPATGAVDTAGAVIKPRHIHAALRKYLGVETTNPNFDLKVPANEMFDFFNPNAKTGYPTL